MNKLAIVLPIFVFVVVLGSNLLNMPHVSILTILLSIFWAAVVALVIFGLIRFLLWWMLH
nr:hypothetical protein [Leuconostoc citreum]